MFKNIECRKEIIERRQYEGDLLSYAFKFQKKAFWIINMLKSMGAEYTLKCFIGKRKVVDIVYKSEVGELFVLNDINIDPAAVGFSATDIESPFLRMKYLILLEIVTKKMSYNSVCRKDHDTCKHIFPYLVWLRKIFQVYCSAIVLMC